jgi:hypothetical protein
VTWAAPVSGVVVGLRDSAASAAALRWASGQARATGLAVCAVHVLEWPIGPTATATGAGTRLHVPQQDVAAPYWRGLHRVFADVDCPPGSVLQFAQGDAGEVLVRLRAQADLLVVGTREPVRRAYLTSPIGHYCIGNAACPVVTVPASHDQRQPAHHHGRRHRVSLPG